MNIHSLTSDATSTSEWRGLRKRLEVADPDGRIAALEHVIDIEFKYEKPLQ